MEIGNKYFIKVIIKYDSNAITMLTVLFIFYLSILHFIEADIDTEGKKSVTCNDTRRSATVHPRDFRLSIFRFLLYFLGGIPYLLALLILYI